MLNKVAWAVGIVYSITTLYIQQTMAFDGFVEYLQAAMYSTFSLWQAGGINMIDNYALTQAQVDWLSRKSK